MERCRDRWQCEGGELISATTVPEPAVPERVSVAGRVVDEQCECTCAGTEATKSKFQFTRHRRRPDEFEAVDGCRQLDATTATIKFWKCTWRRRRKWPAGQLSAAGDSHEVHGADAVVYVARRARRLGNESDKLFFLASADAAVESKLWQQQRKLPEPG